MTIATMLVSAKTTTMFVIPLPDAYVGLVMEVNFAILTMPQNSIS